MSGKQGLASIPRLPALDGLRGISILVVIFFHCLLSTRTSGARLIDPLVDGTVKTLAPVFMDCFFVISGFLITSILDATREADNPLRTFYFRRAFRIIPLYYAFLFAVFLVSSHFPERIVGKPGSMVWEWLFLTNFVVGLKGTEAVGAFFPHFWTLAVEEQFYILWPLLMLLLPARRGVRTCVALIVATVVIRWVVAFVTFDNAVFFLTPTRLDGLAGGGLVALVYRHHRPILEKWWRKGAWLSVGLGAATFVVDAIFWLTGHSPYGNAVWVAAMPLAGSAFFSFVVAGLALRGPGRSPAALVSPVLTSVARYSYGMYALHVPIITTLFHYNLVKQRVPTHGYDLPYRVCFFILIAGLSYGFGLVSWHLYEKQLLKLAPGYRYSRRHDERSVTPPLGAIPAP